MRSFPAERLLALLALLSLIPTATAWTIEPGVQVEFEGTLLTWNTTTEIAPERSLTFDEAGDLVLEGFTLRFMPATSWAWEVLNWDMPLNFTFSGNNSADGRLEVAGANGPYTVLGVCDYPSFEVSEPFFNFTLPACAQTVNMMPTSIAQAGPIELTTSLDVWIPILIWGGLFVFSLYLTAWFPAVVSAMNLAAGLLDPPLWGLAASVMFFVISFAVHAVAVNGIIPTPWRKPR